MNKTYCTEIKHKEKNDDQAYSLVKFICIILNNGKVGAEQSNLQEYIDTCNDHTLHLLWTSNFSHNVGAILPA